MPEQPFAPTVKVYFVEPVQTIAVVINLLIKMNFEVYSVSRTDRDKLLHILNQNKRNVVYFCLLNEKDAPECVKYLEAIQKSGDINTQIGVFVSSIIGYAIRKVFLSQGVATIDLQHLKSKPVETLKKVLLYFDAREKRAYVRARALGVCQAFFTIKNLSDPLKADIIDISVYAFTCKIRQDEKLFFSHKEYIQEVTLLLRGRRIRISARLMGFDKANPDIAIFLICSTKIVKNQLEYHQVLPSDVKHVLYDYIEYYLKEDIKLQLQKISTDS
ncbi:MAG: hypothetical protein JW904_02245 [Spirochaetales bacterium]|nr:hypothetical protein [Spirochaetales bacterium]